MNFTARVYCNRDSARVKTYDEILEEYEFQPETKCADSNGDICTQQTIGLLQRRHVTIDFVKYIGKKSNRLEEVDAGTVHSTASVYTDYEDRARDEWKLKYLPVPKNAPLAKLVEMSGISRRAVIDAGSQKQTVSRKPEFADFGAAETRNA